LVCGTHCSEESISEPLTLPFPEINFTLRPKPRQRQGRLSPTGACLPKRQRRQEIGGLGVIEI